jgi:serine/threonine protein kinase
MNKLKDDAFPRVCEWQPRANGFDVALRWADGTNFAQYLQNLREGKRPPIDPGQAVRLIHGLANGVSKLCQRHQIAHGDIQPANVIITSHSSRLCLIDFGSAWMIQATRNRVEGDGHNRCYAAPEIQTSQIANGFLADQFSVSVLFYELLTQKIPFDGLGGKAGRPEFVEKAGNSLEPPSRHSTLCRNLPKSLREGIDRVSIRGLALNPAERYPDRHAWLDDLFDVAARFRISSELSGIDNALTRVIRWFVRSLRAK